MFVDIDPKTLNIETKDIEKFITKKTKAIVVVHYAGVSCDFSILQSLAKKFNLLIIEDAAQGINSFYNELSIGTIGDIACFSFHETKNIHCGEGGFIVLNNPRLITKAETVRNKGTNRSAFVRGEVAKYEWVGLGFSSMPSAIAAAFL